MNIKFLLLALSASSVAFANQQSAEYYKKRLIAAREEFAELTKKKDYAVMTAWVREQLKEYESETKEFEGLLDNMRSMGKSLGIDIKVLSHECWYARTLYSIIVCKLMQGRNLVDGPAENDYSFMQNVTDLFMPHLKYENDMTDILIEMEHLKMVRALTDSLDE